MKSEQENNYYQKTQSQPVSLNAKTILVVEDDRTHRALVEKILAEAGCTAVSAEDGIVALSKINSGKTFDLIVMDWDMPGLDGLEATKAIRLREMKEGHSHTPIIAFTAHRMPGDRETCIAAGMDAYLPKDVWLPKWREKLLGNLQGLIDGDLSFGDIENLTENHELSSEKGEIDLEEFDSESFEQARILLKDEIGIAIEEYLEDAVAYMRDIEQGLNEKNLKAVSRGSHPLKSNSKGFGLMAVSKIAQSINDEAELTTNPDEAFGRVNELLLKLKDAFALGEEKLKHALQHG